MAPIPRRKGESSRIAKYGGYYRRCVKYPELSYIQGHFYIYLCENSEWRDGEWKAQVPLLKIHAKFGVAPAAIYSWIRGLVSKGFIRVEKVMIENRPNNVYVLPRFKK